MEYDWKYQKGSIIYKSKIKQAKKEMLEYLNIVKYNAFFVTKCFMCSLSPQLESLLKEFFSKQDIWKWKINRISHILYNGMLLQEMRVL